LLDDLVHELDDSVAIGLHCLLDAGMVSTRPGMNEVPASNQDDVMQVLDLV